MLGGLRPTRTVRRRHLAGQTLLAIGRATGLARATVRKYLQVESSAYCQEGLVARQLAAGILREVMPEWSSPGPGFHAYHSSRRRAPQALRASIAYLLGCKSNHGFAGFVVF